MLGQPVSMLIPQVVGFRLKGRLPEGATATDLVLTVTQMLRQMGVVGKFVEFHGEGLAALSLADRATIANMAPEYGATCGIFPVDAETLRYLRFSGRPDSLSGLVEAYAKEQGLFHSATTPPAPLLRKLRVGPGERGAEPGRPDAAARSRSTQSGEEPRSRQRSRLCSASRARRNRLASGRRRSQAGGPRASSPPADERARPSFATARSSSRPSRAAPTRRTRR